jgi:hypothetical protein
MKDDPNDFREDLVSEDNQGVFDQLHAAASELEEESVPMPADLKADLVQHWDEPNNVVSIDAHRSSPWVLPLAAAAAVVLLAVVVFLHPSCTTPSIAKAQEAAEPTGYVIVNRGDASLQRSTDTYQISTSAPLISGDQLVLEGGDQVTVQLADGSTQTLTGPQTYGVAEISRGLAGSSSTALFGHTAMHASLWQGTTRVAGTVSLQRPMKTTAFTNPPILLGQGNTSRLDLRIADEEDTTLYTGALEPNQTQAGWLSKVSLLMLQKRQTLWRRVQSTTSS